MLGYESLNFLIRYVVLAAAELEKGISSGAEPPGDGMDPSGPSFQSNMASFDKLVGHFGLFCLPLLEIRNQFSPIYSPGNEFF